MSRPIRPPDLLVMFMLTALTHEGTVKHVRTGYRPIYESCQTIGRQPITSSRRGVAWQHASSAWPRSG